MASLLQSYWDVFYAQEILHCLPSVIQRNCEGCTFESLSQQDHTCDHLTRRQQLDLYFEDVLFSIDERDILLRWTEAVSSLPEVTQEYRALYQLKLNDPNWRATMKTPVWRNRMIHMVVQLIRLERYF